MFNGVEVSRVARKLIGQLLLQRNLITPAELQNALALQRERKDKIGRILLDLGYLAERDLMAVLSEQHNASLILADEFPAVPLELERRYYKFLKQLRVLPLELSENVLTVAMADPSDTETVESLRLFTGVQPRIRLGFENEIGEALDRLYGNGDDLLKPTVEADGGQISGESVDLGDDIEHLRDL